MQDVFQLSLKVKAQVKEVLENSTELAGTGLQHTRADAVWSSSFSQIEALQVSPLLAGCDVKSSSCLNLK